ncbi:hypothetical protein NL676_020174 [Syzygium grande]|nr:hypothetical protein NL676_020174 [Syzygium grande]
MFDSLRRSIVFRPSWGPDADDAPAPVASTSTPTTPVPTTTRAIVEKINSCIRKSIAFSKVSPPPRRPRPPPPGTARPRSGGGRAS